MDGIKFIKPGVSDHVVDSTASVVEAQSKAAALSRNGGRDNDPGAVKEAASQFESMLVKQMLDSMWATVPNKGMLTGSNEEAIYRDMLSDAIAGDVSKGPGLGIRDIIIRDMNKLKK